MTNKGQKLFIRIVCIILAVVLAGSVLVTILASSAGAVTEAEIKKLQEELSGIRQRQKELKSEINSIEYEKKQIIAKKQVLDQRMELTLQVIDNLTAQIGQYEIYINEKQQEVEARQAAENEQWEQYKVRIRAMEENGTVSYYAIIFGARDFADMLSRIDMISSIMDYDESLYQKLVSARKAAENEQWEQYKVRIRAMEENGTVSYYAIIFGARDFADMLSRIDMISSIMDYDESLYQKLVSARKATEAAKATLEGVKAEMEDKRQEQQDAEAELEVEQQEAIDLLNTLQDNLEEAQALYDQVSEEEDALKDEITKKQKELEATQRVKGTGKFIWPVDSNVVTSPFGPRNTGIAGASTNHKGVDLKASTGAKIYASDTGTVITSALSSSYGNYVVIDHGNGYTTLYAHMSKRAVKQGDKVTKGQVIGYAGATGIANGPHCHFEIWDHGNRVNPLKFFDSSTYIVR